MNAKSKDSSKAGGFSDFEKEAMKLRARELKAEARRGAKKEDGEKDVVAAIAAMSDVDKAIGERLHAVIKAAAPYLSPKTWYGMPAYANKDGKVVCFFRNADRFKERYVTVGFNQEARLDDGNMWPITFALTKLTKAEEARITELVKQAVG